MKVYMTYESCDYELWDTSASKIFTTKSAAEAYSMKHRESHGYNLDIAQFELESVPDYIQPVIN